MALEIDTVAKSIRGNAKGPLRNQMVRAAMSVPANIVEGRNQQSEKEFARYLRYALGSAGELDYHLLCAKDTRAITESAYRESEQTVSEVRKMLRGLLKKVEQSANL